MVGTIAIGTALHASLGSDELDDRIASMVAMEGRPVMKSLPPQQLPRITMPIPSDVDLWRSAGIMVRKHGSRAPTAASDRAKRLEVSDDKDGAAAWRLIAQRCESLLNEEGTRQ